MMEWATPSGIAVGVSSVAALHLWIGAMLLLRGQLGKYRTDNPEMERQHSEYHNSSIYRDFSFFYKVTLAVIGGVFLLACKGECANIDDSTVAALIRLAGYLQFASGLLFSFFIFAHQKSKIEHWKPGKRYGWGQIILWQETWMVVAIIAVSATLAFGVTPYLASAVGAALAGG